MVVTNKDEKEFYKYDILDSYSQLLDQYTSYLFYEGLDATDYEDIERIISRLNTMRQKAYCSVVDHKRLNGYILNDSYSSEEEKQEYLKVKDAKEYYLTEIEDIKDRFELIHMELKKQVIPTTLRSVIKDTGSLLHAIYTNNKCEKIKLYSDASVMFLCQFHNEKTPSFGVTDSVGLCFCFACGASFNIVDYIMEYENLTYQEAVQLLSKIYLIDIQNNNWEENHPLVLKYRNSLFSDGFRNLLDRGYERIKERNIKSNDSNGARWGLKKYEQTIETIERVKRGELQEFTSNREKQKRLILEMPSFD